jgi:carbamoyl-phosphate synthase small subunit
MLALEDGTVYTGRSFGAGGEQWGEVVFNTGMTGYQEVLTDPSYCGQIVVMTYPLIGNYGTAREDDESRKSFVRGFVVREDCRHPSNWRAGGTIADFLTGENVIGLAGIDTRSLTRRLRSYGAMRGVISTITADAGELAERARSSPYLTGQELVPLVAAREAYTIPGSGKRVVLMDFGAKKNIVRCLAKRDCEVIVAPPDTGAADVLAFEPDGIVLSNGPGDPVDVPYAVAAVRRLIDKKPILGICLGHQILALAMGAKTYKMKFGHRGANHPVKDLATGRVYISSHNHGFSVDEESLEGLDIYVSHRNLNDGTVEGLKHKFLPVFSVQYHPEAAPGPADSEYIFDQFLAMMRQGRR